MDFSPTSLVLFIAIIVTGECQSEKCTGLIQGMCCSGQVWNNVSNACESCAPGYYGKTCSDPCKHPYYGMSCMNKCNCSESECNPTLGCNDFAPSSNPDCSPGFYGKTCSTLCKKPYYGMHCMNECNCVESECNPVFGCRDPVSSPIPDTRSVNIFHQNDSDGYIHSPAKSGNGEVRSIRRCCAGQVWNNISNTCEYCSPGYFGKTCSTLCKQPYYGMRCMNKCTCSESECHPIFGCRDHVSSPIPDIGSIPIFHLNDSGNLFLYPYEAELIQNFYMSGTNIWLCRST
ncbi:multiple epidermal growth factor-like domains protein 10 [Ostrea edulis]|uniref:multiple epidermal growth factor-like domains protein 10 n=1 Tax=Ostrea edulis TaxID=37623 RepID=UPI0024AE8C46|nr:multiple epidermal growth factor-like domains protein 10 [Ostrea edulis]